MTDDDGILGKVRPHGFSPAEVQEYEIAIDALNSVIGIYSARYHEERDNPTAAAALRAEISRYVQLQKSLSPGDRERVAEVRRECVAIIQEARQRPTP